MSPRTRSALRILWALFILTKTHIKMSFWLARPNVDPEFRRRVERCQVAIEWFMGVNPLGCPGSLVALDVVESELRDLQAYGRMIR
jgi:hypothetical protein